MFILAIRIATNDRKQTCISIVLNKKTMQYVVLSLYEKDVNEYSLSLEET